VAIKINHKYHRNCSQYCMYLWNPSSSV